MFFDVSANPEIIERVRTRHVESDSTKTSGLVIPPQDELISVLLYLNGQDFMKSNHLFVSIDDNTILFHHGRGISSPPTRSNPCEPNDYYEIQKAINNNAKLSPARP